MEEDQLKEERPKKGLPQATEAYISSTKMVTGLQQLLTLGESGWEQVLLWSPTKEGHP